VNISSIFLDFNGTLVDSKDASHRVYTDVLQKFGYDKPFSLADYTARSHYRHVENYQHLLNRQDVADVVEYHSSLHAKYAHHVRVYPHVLETLSRLHRKGITLAIVSSASRSKIVPLLKRHNIQEYFKAVISGDDVQNPKPHPEPIKQALAATETAPQVALMVGDSTADIEAARSAGVRSVGVTYGNFPAQVTAARPDFLIHSFDELLRLVA
jgi:HAD superfamily hydrolase (TIGR01509 family)